MDEFKMRIMPRMSNPILGSGRIARRCLVKKYKKEKSHSEKLHDSLFKRINTIPNPISKKPVKKQIKFPTLTSKIIFNYWNNLGHPFVRHQPIKSKVTSKGIERIEKAVKKYGKEKVINSIAIAEKVFNSGWFRWRLAIGYQKVSLPEFFLYSSESYKAYNKKIKNLPNSWFEECRKGYDYMEKKYSVVKTDKFPHITEKLESIWMEYSGLNTELRNKEQLKSIAGILEAFCEANKFDWLTIVDVMDGMLNRWKNYKPKHLGYMSNEIFWKETLPREIVRFGLVDQEFKWNR
ncbi:MAG TPA: hypothetical protein VMX17_14435 [Candidatus Glassbacteria bacterium]|nr:hypothetical protein [Candidatus Glassbacteria bacterium]